MKLLKWYSILMILMAGACVEPYDPPLDDEDVNFLVVDGFLNVTEGVANVRLTRTQPVKDSGPARLEQAATVRVEDDNGLTHSLLEISGGVYSGNIENAALQTSYRLLIFTSDGHQYASDFIHLLPTPSIDSITYSITNDGVEFSVTTHDPAGLAKHFRWKYTETYEYHSNFVSSYKFEPNRTVILRPAEEQSGVCWRTNVSTDIMVASSKHLSNSVISKFGLNIIPFGSLKLTVEYSMLVQQQTLSDEAYDYWLNLEKTTEHLGGLFDPLPAEVPGNVHSLTHANEKVIGFFSGSEVTEARIFLKRRALPREIMSLFRNPFCALDTIMNEDLQFAAPSTILVDAIYPISGPGGPIGYTTAETRCVDCTVHGGTKEKPPFWE
jgi:hypothetical protein